MGNKTVFIGIIFLVALVAGFVFINSGNANSAPITGNVVAGETQKAILSQDDLNYKDVRVQAGKPIAINADSSVTGCLRAPAFNFGGKKYSKYLQNNNDILELPALEKGTYSFSCTMGMGQGKLIVE
ncbi:MAG: cupredoxin domain-containing protein [Nanoarchaeota archaeon]